MFENSFQFTAHGINSHTSTQIFSNRYGQLLHVHVVQISITVIKWLENHLNVLKGQMTPVFFPKFDMIVVLVLQNFSFI